MLFIDSISVWFLAFEALKLLFEAPSVPSCHHEARYCLWHRATLFPTQGNIRNTEKLSYDRQQQYEIQVTAWDCGQKRALHSVPVRIDVKPVCKPGWQGGPYTRAKISHGFSPCSDYTARNANAIICVWLVCTMCVSACKPRLILQHVSVLFMLKEAQMWLFACHYFSVCVWVCVLCCCSLGFLYLPFCTPLSLSLCLFPVFSFPDPLPLSFTPRGIGLSFSRRDQQHVTQSAMT